MNEELHKRIISSVVLLPILFFIILKGSYYFIFIALACFIISFYEWQKIKINLIIKIIGTFYLIFSFYTIIKLRMDFNNDYFIFLIICLICIFSDLGGYIFGKTIKGPKLTTLSPNKTYAGMFGSYFLCVIFSFILIELDFFSKNLNYNMLIFVLIISTVSQAGDITVSYFKRISKIKDTGRIIPGHGGLLDRIDGMIFAFPTSFLILKINFFKVLV